MKHVIVLAHPSPSSLNASIASAYAEAAKEKGDVAVLRNLYAVNFDPRLPLAELPFVKNYQPAAEVVEERTHLQDADVIALVYPLWLNTPPAIMKGYLERVFGYGFAYTRGSGGMKPLLTNKRLITFSTSGAPEEWVRKTGSFEALRVLFDVHLADMCGMDVIDHVHFGNVSSMMREDVIHRYLDTVRSKVSKL